MLVAQSCLTLCNSKDCSPPGSSVHGILQARMLEWVAMPASKESFEPRDKTGVLCISGRFFTFEATREAHSFRDMCNSLILFSRWDFSQDEGIYIYTHTHTHTYRLFTSLCSRLTQHCKAIILQ